MMKKLFLFFTLVIPLYINGQSVQIDIEWIDTDSIPFFQNALYENNGNSLPHYVKKIPWDDIQNIPHLHISNLKSGSIDNQEAIQKYTTGQS